MRRYPTNRFVGVLIGLILIGAGNSLPAGEPPSEKALAKHGLKRAGDVLVLQAESEVHAKAEDVRKLSAQLSHAIAQQRATLSEKEYQDTIKELTAGLNQLRAESNAVTQNINRLPKFRTRRGTYFANNYVTEEYQELNQYKNQLQMEINQRTTFLNQLKSKPFDRKDRIKADNEVRERQEALHQGALDLRKLVEDAHARYLALAKEPQVKKWLETPEGHAGVKPRLGPSRAFLQDEKLLERVERDSAPEEPGAPAHKPSHKGRRAVKARHPAGSANPASPF